MQVYSGSSNPALAKKLASKLRVRLGKIEVSRFANDEGRVFVTEPKVDSKVIVVQSLSIPTDTHLVEFCLICDALRRKGAKRIIAVTGMTGEVKGKRVIIKDDMIATGSTMIEVSKFLKAKGAKSIEVGAVHHLYVPGTQSRLNRDGIDQLVVTDTVAAPAGTRGIKVLSVAGILAKAIRA